jgi:hypothetical protein
MVGGSAWLTVNKSWDNVNISEIIEVKLRKFWKMLGIVEIKPTIVKQG